MRAKFVYEQIENILRPKSEEEINKSLEEVYDKIALELLEYEFDDDYVEAYEFVISHSDKVKELIRRGWPIDHIAYILYFGERY